MTRWGWLTAFALAVAPGGPARAPGVIAANAAPSPAPAVAPRPDAAPAIDAPRTDAPARPPRIALPAGELVPFFAPRATTDAAGAPATGPAATGTAVGALARATTGARPATPVPAFALDAAPVTNADMLRFVTSAPSWRRSQIARSFAEATYLSRWAGDLDLGSADAAAPVTQVSWFAAQAYCRARGGALPTTVQWEYALADAGRGQAERRALFLKWFAEPSDRAPGRVAQGAANGYGVYDLAGLIWEWTLDFGADLLGSEPRNNGTPEEALVCGAGSLGALDPSDYATFMRYSFRASLRAAFTTGNLGFRCAYPLYTVQLPPSPTRGPATAQAPRRRAAKERSP